jgi:F-type H+-transporting ATPase subunit a
MGTLLADDQTQQINDNVTHQTIGSGLLQLNVDTLFVTGIAIAILVVIGLVIRSQLGKEPPNGFVSFIEMIVEFIDGLVTQTLGDRRQKLRVLPPLAICLFTYLLVSNLMGLVPTMHSPTNDVNTALALAIVSITFLHISSVRARGPVGYVKHYFSVVQPKPLPFGWLPRLLFGFLEVIQELSRPVTLTFRLYFNIFVGELLLLLITLLFPVYLLPASLILGTVWFAFSIFVSAVQAFIFTMLTIAYVSMGTDTHEEAHEGHASDESHADHAMQPAPQGAS